MILSDFDSYYFRVEELKKNIDRSGRNSVITSDTFRHVFMYEEVKGIDAAFKLTIPT